MCAICSSAAPVRVYLPSIFWHRPRVRKTGIYGTYISGSGAMMRSFGYKMRSFGYKPVGGRGHWRLLVLLCCFSSYQQTTEREGTQSFGCALHFSFYFLVYFSHTSLVVASFSSNRSKAKSKHKHRSKSCYNVYMPSYVHQSQTQGIYTYITRCVTKRKTPTK